MKTINQHLNAAREDAPENEELFKKILSRMEEEKAPRLIRSPYVAYLLTSCVSVYTLFILMLPVFNNYMLYKADNAVDAELMALDTQANLFQQQIDAEDLANVTKDIQ